MTARQIHQEKTRSIDNVCAFIDFYRGSTYWLTNKNKERSILSLLIFVSIIFNLIRSYFVLCYERNKVEKDY